MENNNGDSIKKIIRLVRGVRRVATLIPTIVGCLPFLLMVGVVIFIAILVAALAGSGDDAINLGSRGCKSVKTVDSICEEIVVNNGPAISVDEYVAGVVQAEVGGFDNIEIKKALAVAARTYALNTASVNNGVCDMGTAGPSSQAYSSSPSEQSIQAANDTSGMILVDSGGKPAFSQYDAFAWYEEKGGYFYLQQGGTEEEHQKVPAEWVRARYTQSDLVFYANNKHGNGMSQVGGYYLATEKQYDFEQILDFYYSDEGFSLASTNGSSNQVCDGNLQTLDHYTLRHENLNILDHTLSSSEIESLNASLENEIKKAGHGSGAAVAAVGQGLVYWLEKYKNAYLSYYWAGGHGGFDSDDTVIGGNSNWGSTKFGVDTHNRNYRPYFGMDCSGFVSWATRMACNPKFASSYLSDSYYRDLCSAGACASGAWNEWGDSVSFSDVVPGDVLTNNNHIQLVVKNNGDGTIYVAEEIGMGLVFSQLSAGDSSGYYIRSMRNWYAKNCIDIQPGTGSSGSSSGNLSKDISNYIAKKATDGKWSVYVKDLKNSKVVTSINSSNAMISASVIKLFIAGSAYDQVSKDNITASSISNDVKKMIEVSDNDSANALIDLLEMDTINEYISRNGYRRTRLNRLMLKPGNENIVTAQDVGKFLESLYNGKIVNSEYSNQLIGYMKSQDSNHVRSKIPAGLGCKNCSANKSGELSEKGVANDAAIVYSPNGDYVIVVLSEVTPSKYENANKDVVEISKLVYDYFN